jgi:hypothetical protein
METHLEMGEACTKVRETFILSLPSSLFLSLLFYLPSHAQDLTALTNDLNGRLGIGNSR